MRTLKCAEVEDALAALALGALDEDERRLVQSHLDTCLDCREQFAGYAEVSRGLLNAVPQRMPPPVVKAGLMARVQQPQRAPRGARLRAWLRGAVAAPRWAFGAALALLLLVSATLGTQVARLTSQQAQLAAQLQQQQRALASLANTNSAVMTMDGTTEATGAWAVLRYNPDNTLAVFQSWKLPTLSTAQAYQLWLVDEDGHRDSGAVFNVPTGTDGKVTLVVMAPRPLKSYVGCGVSIEPNGGSPQPTGPAALTGKPWL
jgi:anti-sigma-K factor RskA